MNESALIYSEHLLEKEVRSFWRGVVGPLYIFAMALMTIPFTYFVYTNVADYSWIVGVLARIFIKVTILDVADIMFK